MVKFKTLPFLTGFATIILLGGCLYTRKVDTSTTPQVQEEIKRLAVLPFDNISKRKDAGKIVTNIFVSELITSQSFEVIEPGNIKQFFIEEEVNDIGEMDIERLKLLGRRFGVNAVIVGTVEEFDDGVKGGGSSMPVVSITARMVSTEDGKVIWPGFKKKRGNDSMIPFGFGNIRSVTSLIKSIVNEMIEDMK